MINTDFKTYYSVLMQNRKMLVVISLLCALLFGGYKLYTGLNSMSGSEESLKADYTEQMELYNTKKANVDNYINLIEKNISSGHQRIKENPILSLDPNNCEYESILITYEDPDITRDTFLRNTVSGMNPEFLFGNEGDTLDAYKTDIIYIPYPETGAVAESGKTQIYCFPAGGLTAKEIADKFLKKIDPDGANTIAGAKVQLITRTSGKGFCYELKRRQDDILNYPLALEEDMRRVKEQGRLIAAPTAATSTVSKRSVLISTLKYAIGGFLIGLIGAIALVLYKISTSGIILSKKQIEQTLDLDCIGSVAVSDISSGDADLILKNIEAVSLGLHDVMLLDESHTDSINKLKNLLNNSVEKEKTYECGKNILDDLNTIDASRDVDGIILCIDKGVSNITNVQQSIIRANSLNKKVLGYVFVE